MSDGLREALEELRTEVAVLHDDAGLESSDQSAGEFHAYKRMMNRLNELLAAHPVEPATEIVVDHRPGDTCYVAANIDPETGWSRGIAEGGGITDEAARAAIHAINARRFGPAPITRGDMIAALEAALPLMGLQQVPSQQAIEAVLREFKGSVNQDSIAQGRIARAVLALFSKPAAEPQCICHMIVDTYPDPDCPQYSEHILPAEEGS